MEITFQCTQCIFNWYTFHWYVSFRLWKGTSQIRSLQTSQLSTTFLHSRNTGSHDFPPFCWRFVLGKGDNPSDVSWYLGGEHGLTTRQVESMMALLHPATSFGPVAYLACIGYDDYPGYVGIIMIASIKHPAFNQPVCHNAFCCCSLDM